MSLYLSLKKYCEEHDVALVAVSKTQPIQRIQDLYDVGQRIFGENKLQELLDKKALLPDDVQWHLIGHLQSNKVKQAIQSATLIHSVDSLHLIECIEKEAAKLNMVVKILLQVKIATEDTKYGMVSETLHHVMQQYIDGMFPHIHIKGLMGMASFIEEEPQIKNEFIVLKKLYDLYVHKNLHLTFDTLSMGMSGDYKWAVECGSNMVRIGSLLFGSRQ